MYIIKYKCRFCGKSVLGKIITTSNLDELNLSKIKEMHNISDQIIHNTIGHLGVADLIGFEDYDSYKLSKLQQETETI